MVNIQMNGRRANIEFTGNPAKVAMELVTAISGIYQGLDNQDPMDAEFFKESIQRLVQDGSPVWTEKHDLFMVVAPTIKKSDTHTDQS